MSEQENSPPSTASSASASRSSTRVTTNLVTLVFTDIVGSTSLKQLVGDRAGAALLEEHDRLVRATLAEFPRGQEIGTAGDSFFCAFVTPSEAVKFALLVQAKLREFNKDRATKINDRIGIHLGEVVVKDAGTKLQSKDLYGLSLDTCARVMICIFQRPAEGAVLDGGGEEQVDGCIDGLAGRFNPVPEGCFVSNRSWRSRRRICRCRL